MSTALATPIVTVNDLNVSIMPNSTEYDDGFGERNVRVEASGPGESQTVVTENQETQLSMVKFSLLSTIENANTVREWLKNLNANTITLVQGEFSRSFRNGTITNNPTIMISQDGNFDVEFKCDRAA